MRTEKAIKRNQEHGFALMTALLFLVLLTLVSISMFQSQGLLGKMAGHFREKGKAFEAAQAALGYAESLLSQPTLPTVTACNAVVDTPRICTTPIVDPTNLTWNVGSTYRPSVFTTASSGMINYSDPPIYYIFELDSANVGGVYQINAIGYGGNRQTVSVLQSTYMAAGNSGSDIGR